MQWNCRLTSCVLGGCLIAATAVEGENWPGWRGPRGDGTSLESKVPLHWNGTTGENLSWNMPLHGSPHAPPTTCASPLLYKDLVIGNGDHDGDGYIVPLNKNTGQTIWKSPRPNQTRSYVTPIIREVAGHTQMVFCGSKCVASLDPSDGSPHWIIDGPTEQYVASMVFDGKLFFLAAGFPTYHVMGIRPDGQGNVTQTHVAWEATNAKCYVPSP